jgi:ArsR family transcriptional regulator
MIDIDRAYKGTGYTIGLLDAKKLKEAQQAIETLRKPNASELLVVISRRGEANVDTIWKCVMKSQSNVSHYLAELRARNLVTTREDGRFVYYRLNYDRLEQIERAINHLDV